MTKRFNLILSAFTYAFCDIPQYHTNQLYTPVVAQCALKVDYIYQEKMEEYNKLSLDEEFEIKKEKDDKQKGSQHMKEYNSVLFSLPSIQPTSQNKKDQDEITKQFNSVNPLIDKNIIGEIIELNVKKRVEKYIPPLENEDNICRSIKYVTINSKGETITSKEKKYICKKID